MSPFAIEGQPSWLIRHFFISEYYVFVLAFLILKVSSAFFDIMSLFIFCQLPNSILFSTNHTKVTIQTVLKIPSNCLCKPFLEFDTRMRSSDQSRWRRIPSSWVTVPSLTFRKRLQCCSNLRNIEGLTGPPWLAPHKPNNY